MKRLKVLVVDDEESYVRHIARVLDANGCAVKTAKNAHDALRVGREFSPEVLLIDWMLRDSLDGLEVAKSLLSIYPQLKIIVMTGYPAEHFHDRGTGFTPFALLEKPFESSEVKYVVERARRS